KMHRSIDVAKLQIKLGNACGVCCQKVAEAEVFARSGIKDILVTNEIRDLVKIDRLARIPKLGARTIVIVDDVANVADLYAAAHGHGTELECLVEIDCGGSLAGVSTIPEVVELAGAIDAAPGLVFSGIQAYNGVAQHQRKYDDRRALIDASVVKVRNAVDALTKAGLMCDIIGGAGTGTYYFEGNSGVYNELQCGSYAFMDHDYGQDLDKEGKPIAQGEWENALFILTMITSHKKRDVAICDAGLKVQSMDSGLPVVFGREELTYLAAADEHGIIIDPNGALKVGDKLRLVPGHCDPTCNVHDWYVGVRNDKVEVVWPISARGKSL
ncbi:MAG: DSD1 family PLP-dependent enzyme, partial [Dehalococcoidia bacterium]|nr:DSD1 family PLP-dependent enzyme [Dehalococcoidia bacterium]